MELLPPITEKKLKRACKKLHPVSACSRLWSLALGYAITSNRIGSSELNENAFKGLALARLFVFAKD